MSETTADALFPEGDLEGERGCGPAMRELVRWWELRRLAYDVVLLLVGLPLTWALVRFAGEKAAPGEILLAGATFFAAANACYFLGPLAELYAGALRQAKLGREVRLLLFVTGTAFSVLVIGGTFLLGLLSIAIPPGAHWPAA